MKIKVFYSRRIIVPIEEPYKNVTYETGLGYEIDANELKNWGFESLEDILHFLEKEVDTMQREKIKEECNVTKLIIDKSKGEKIRLKMKNK